MGADQFEIQRFEVNNPHVRCHIEALCITCGQDLVVVIGGGNVYHVGAMALTLSLPGIKDRHKLTNSTYQVPVPGHKEENLAREGSQLLSKELGKNVVVIAGIHQDNINKSEISEYVECFNRLIKDVCAAYKPAPGT